MAILGSILNRSADVSFHLRALARCIPNLSMAASAAPAVSGSGLCETGSLRGSTCVLIKAS
jgi:hypothetical protein